MNTTIYLLAAFGFTWVIIFAYVFTISKRQEALEIQISHLEDILETDQD